MDTATPGQIAEGKSPLVSEGRILYASIVALALGVIPILALSDRMGLREMHLTRMVFCNILLAAAVCGFFLVRDGHRKLAALLLASWSGWWRQLERIADEAQRMDTLLMALLGFGRISRRPLAFTEVNLSAMTARIAEEFAATPEGARTRFTIHPKMKVQADRHLMHAVLENLMGNALKFSHGHESPAIEVGRENTHGGDAFYVRDNGAGFDPAFASHLYKPFHRLHADSEFSGIGMGLASVRRIIERLGGSIWAESAPGKGATFYFTLPERRG